jgi:hypothetical protein
MVKRRKILVFFMGHFTIVAARRKTRSHSDSVSDSVSKSVYSAYKNRIFLKSNHNQNGVVFSINARLDTLPASTRTAPPPGRRLNNVNE